MGADLESLIWGLIKNAWIMPIISYVMMAVDFPETKPTDCPRKPQVITLN